MIEEKIKWNLKMDYETILKKQITNKEDRKLFSYAIKDGVKFERAMSLYELYKKNKSKASYEWDKNSFKLNYFDKMLIRFYINRKTKTPLFPILFL